MINNRFVEKKIEQRTNPVEVSIEEKIVNAVITGELVNKEYAKLLNSTTAFKSIQAALLSVIFQCLIAEELYDQLKNIKCQQLTLKNYNGIVLIK